MCLPIIHVMDLNGDGQLFKSILDMYRKEKFKSKDVNSKFANGALIEYGIRQLHPLAVLLQRQI